MAFIYNLFVTLLIFGMKVFSLFNDKTKKGVEGRKRSLEKVKAVFTQKDRVIWMHAASLGEYEQGLPVLERLKDHFPEHKILVTFFSPSGYENVVKKKHIADVICYLPFDKKSIINEFITQFNTELFFTVKYDYWYNLLAALKNRNTKIYVISALFYERQSFFTSYGKWFVKQLKKNVDWFFHQTQFSIALAKSIGLLQSSVTGDTRFDRVKQLRERDNHVDHITDFIGNDKAIVFGSSWQAEEKMAEMISRKNRTVKMIIAPHDLKRVEHLKSIFPDAVLYSQISQSQHLDFVSQVLIIDSIGLLSKLYSYADVAVVGGGFHDAGLHNILEAATFGVPVIFGNHYKKNPEADDLIAAEGGKSFKDEYGASEFVLFLTNEDNQEELKTMSQNARRFISDKPDSTTMIIEKILS
ncbi:3-deoxy-D-manno-octulosonic acid transferase [Chryseobacterium indologenes]|uniref:3-deoxy-D-manno-octulosonic acid transferase n=1 Tax=Chryseobacterium indologenes TaxID=253 RepID=UPI000F4EDBB1|nr:glycosyltransferase N-terminal domain-containing protein [Chryseobacterium indologenes]AYZ34216.1 3-deoxy-D-manno-octulosonic acid transferase [Chryseobacterium indologenes]MBF6642739.1 3-deoxy-D-manno-octulosonic acid transferase [Chryseobacterium indologenes]MBU3049989.1 3-deoxy-D-manno-octulosonic acid transferase [Chryseobacterium indologenes]MEB4762784.1 3-deoxy-D-manno-octulosonic acid transferase [Chryseobacterium indologenes]QQQ69211.1 3-deoxy-D-manno-octulosonic acid transferase [C